MGRRRDDCPRLDWRNGSLFERQDSADPRRAEHKWRTISDEPGPAHQRGVEHDSFGDEWLRHKSDDERRAAVNRFANVDTLTPMR